MNFDIIDKIYFLHLSDRYDREKWINNQIEKMGFPKDKVTIWWTCRHDMFENIWDKFDKIKNSPQISFNKKTNPNIGLGVFNCSLAHYDIIRTSYDRGYEHILIFEDDNKFLTNLEIFKYVINKLPDNYNILKFHNISWKNNQWKEMTTNFCPIPKSIEDIQEPIFTIIDNINQHYQVEEFASTQAYLINRNAMKRIINIYNNDFCPADWVFINIDHFYICNYQLLTSQDYNCNPQEYLWSELWELNSKNKFSNFL